MHTSSNAARCLYIDIKISAKATGRDNSIEVDAPASPKKLDYKTKNALVLES